MEIWFEAVPSPAGADDHRIRTDVAPLQALKGAGADRILVPEVADTGFQSVDSIRFARAASKAAGLPAGVAVVTATRSHDDVDARIQEADRNGVDTLLLVGPARGDTTRGPSVTEALASHACRRRLGVVTIPGRDRPGLSEAERLLEKHQAGARFAVSQILFDASSALESRREYVQRLGGQAPIPCYYALAPVCRQKDIRFLRSLGVEIPQAVADRLYNATLDERASVAREIAIDVARQLVSAHEKEGLGPIGFCISHVMFPNVDEAIALLKALRESLQLTVAPTA